jgi:hypothetical protein
MSERRSAFAKARSIADTYWTSFAKAAAALATAESGSSAIREKPALVG